MRRSTRFAVVAVPAIAVFLAGWLGGWLGGAVALAAALALALAAAWRTAERRPPPAVAAAAPAPDPVLVAEAMRAREGATALSAGVVDLLTTAETTTERAASVAAAAARVRDDTQTIAAGAEEMSATVREIATTTGDAARLAGEAAGLAADAESAIRRLGDSSQAIGTVVDAISAIAGQTNLLALNATIEAARAGQAGRGFAVVAGEVKSLAHQTADATADVGRRIAAIQADTAAAVAAIAAITARISRIHEVQQTVAAAVEEQSATTQEMSRTIGGTAQGAAAIAGDIAGVADDARRAAMATVVVRDLAHAAVVGSEGALRRVDPASARAGGHGVPPELFDRAIRAHIGWRTRLLAAIEGAAAPDRAAADPAASELGRCLAERQEALARHPAYADLVEQHRRFHHELGAVIDLIAAKRADEARAAVLGGGFAQASEAVLGLIARLKPLGAVEAKVSLEWRADYATGVPEIDAQHRELFAKVAALHAAMMSGAGRAKVAELVGFLAEYTVSHFADEERLMQRSRYPELEAHRKLHHELLGQVSALRAKLDAGEAVKTMEVTDFLGGWLRHHILQVDHAYVPSLRAAGLAAP